MSFAVTIHPCEAGQIVPLAPWPSRSLPAHYQTTPGEHIPMDIGATLETDDGIPFFRVISSIWLPDEDAGTDAAFFRLCPMLRALKNFPEKSTQVLHARKTGYALACVTLSDKGAAGVREDLSGPLIARLLGETLPLAWHSRFMIPDDPNLLRPLLTSLALEQHYDLICTTGGTGVSPRDKTPEATAQVLDCALPGFSEAMRAASLQKTPNAMISRALAGIIGKCLVINLPGSQKAVRENLETILPALSHALAKINGNPADCGG